MKIVLQRVKSASVSVCDKICGQIDNGYLVLVGFGADDTESDCERLAEKIINLRVFSDENGKINLNLADVNGSLLIVSQFTLYADCRKGNRPNFIMAAKPDKAESLYNYFISCCQKRTANSVETGIFGADMEVCLINDGPFTIILE
ncbi:MAG: D-aminoacyl-tRNA deacylase [Oscillospiraceae bacterium]|nr:D-aminoacyl-tRNA deacylase [Oscillospiraceae bacterium]